ESCATPPAPATNPQPIPHLPRGLRMADCGLSAEGARPVKSAKPQAAEKPGAGTGSLPCRPLAFLPLFLSPLSPEYRGEGSRRLLALLVLDRADLAAQVLQRHVQLAVAELRPRLLLAVRPVYYLLVSLVVLQVVQLLDAQVQV